MVIARSRAMRLRRGLDRAGPERRGPRLGADLVDAGEAVQEAAQRSLAGGDVGVRREPRGSLRGGGGWHSPSIGLRGCQTITLERAVSEPCEERRTPPWPRSGSSDSRPGAAASSAASACARGPGRRARRDRGSDGTYHPAVVRLCGLVGVADLGRPDPSGRGGRGRPARAPQPAQHGAGARSRRSSRSWSGSGSPCCAGDRALHERRRRPQPAAGRCATTSAATSPAVEIAGLSYGAIVERRIEQAGRGGPDAARGSSATPTSSRPSPTTYDASGRGPRSRLLAVLALAVVVTLLL